MTENLIEEIIVTIADAGFAAACPELHHYTTHDGLAGIYQSNTLRASHFTSLNDSTEVILFREPLTSALETRFEELIRTKARQDRRILVTIFKAGGAKKVSSEVARALTDSLYQVTFEGGASYEFCDTFIASFCAHSDQSYESKNGLLSQWRGYGVGGGFCIVFDTAKLITMLAQEFEKWHYVRINIDNVHYALDEKLPANLFTELVGCCEALLTEVLKGNMEPSAKDAFLPFVKGATLYKHQGFREENEIRIVAMPGSQELLDQVNKQSEVKDARPCKSVNVVKNKTGKRNYITLFDSVQTALPIKRVIVGPSKNQAKNFDWASTLLPKDLMVTKSATPFIG